VAICSSFSILYFVDDELIEAYSISFPKISALHLLGGRYTLTGIALGSNLTLPKYSCCISIATSFSYRIRASASGCGDEYFCCYHISSIFSYFTYSS